MTGPTQIPRFPNRRRVRTPVRAVRLVLTADGWLTVSGVGDGDLRLAACRVAGVVAERRGGAAGCRDGDLSGSVGFEANRAAVIVGGDAHVGVESAARRRSRVMVGSVPPPSMHSINSTVMPARKASSAAVRARAVRRS